MLWVKMEDYSVYEEKNSGDDCDVECADLLPKIYLFICEFCRSGYFNTKLNDRSDKCNGAGDLLFVSETMFTLL